MNNTEVSRNDHEAYKEKDLKTIEEKKNIYNNFLEFKKKIFKPTENQNNIHLIYPVINEVTILEEILHKLSFSLPSSKEISIIVPIDNSLRNTDLSFYSNEYKNITYIEEDKIENYISNNIILIHSMKDLNNFQVLEKASRIEIIDKEYFSDIEAETLRNLYYRTLTSESKNIFTEISKENFEKFRLRNIHKKQAFCFTTGPSFDSYSNFIFPKNSLIVICNSIVKNDSFIKYMKEIDLITFADPVFHFGPSDYAEIFRKDVLNLLKTSEAYISVPEINVPLMIKHYPELKNRIIGIKSESVWNLPSKKKLYVKNTSNILTLLMIPLASSVADTIFILGADGRNSNEKYFWNHSSSAQYTDYMETVFKAHPSFFRDRVYEDYYKEHCKTLENLIQYGEFLGKVYLSITKSFIPALENRWIDFNLPKNELLNKIELIRDKNKEIYQKEETPVSLEDLNKDFAMKMNCLYAHIQKIKNSKAKIAIYGNGLVGNLIAKEIKNQVVVICDQNPNSKSELSKVCLPNELENFDFDFLVISVLGRESTIIKNLNIDKNKILTIDFREKGLNNFNLVFLDKNSKEYLEKNMVGPFTRESGLSFNETEMIFKYLNKYNGNMIDVGAHFGTSAKLFLENNWNVFCYEPDPNNRKKLLANLEKYPNKIISEKAISNKINELVVFYNSDESTGISSLLPFNENHKKICEVKTSTLTKEIEENKIENVDFLKIDTEGYDFMVLQGFPWDLMKPSIIECEYEDSKTTKLGYTVKEMINFLKSKKYHIYVSEWHPIIRYGIRHEWKRFFKYENQNINPKSWGNIIAFSKEIDETILIKLIRDLMHI